MIQMTRRRTDYRPKRIVGGTQSTQYNETFRCQFRK